MRKFTFHVTEQEDGLQVQELLKNNGYSKRMIIALKQTSDGLLLNGVRTRSTSILRCGDTLETTMPDSGEKKRKSDMAIPVIYEDDDIIVCDKPAGIVCHSSGGHQSDTLEHIFSERTLRAVYRLDKDTSGLIVLAKHQLAAGRLHGKIEKEYLAVTEGALSQKDGAIELPIMREFAFEPRMIVDEAGMPSRTVYRVVWEGEGRSAVLCKLPTGRMHQIRVHFSYIGHPLVGDTLYGSASDDISRQALHCMKISFLHPVTGEACSFSADIPKDMGALFQDKTTVQKS